MGLSFSAAGIAGAALGLVIAACASPAGTDEGQGSASNAVSVNSDKVEGQFFLTTFGGPDDSGDNGELACGGNSDPNSDDVHQKYYAADKQRFGCGTHIRVEANGKCIILETTDTGPAAFVEDKAGGPVLDATPLAAEELFGESSFGWSDRKAVQLTIADANTPLGPCSGSTDDGSTPDPSTDTGDDDDDTTTPTPPDPTCQPKAPATLCQAARTARGVACGYIVDNCGASLDCSSVSGFTCATGSCVHNKCTGDATTCQPKAAAEACGSAKASSGAECGFVADGCKGTVSCHGQPGYGCADGQICAKNHCQANAAPASNGGPSEKPVGTTASTPSGGVGTAPGDSSNGNGAGTEDPTSTGSSTTPPPKPSTKSASAGCSAAPTSGSAGSPQSLGLVGLVGALTFARRRRRRPLS